MLSEMKKLLDWLQFWKKKTRPSRFYKDRAGHWYMKKDGRLQRVAIKTINGEEMLIFGREAIRFEENRKRKELKKLRGK